MKGLEARLLAWMALLGLVMLLAGLLWPRWDRWRRYRRELNRLVSAATEGGCPLRDFDELREQARREAG